MNPLQRIQTVETFMTRICKNTNLGGYNVLAGTLGFFQSLLHPTQHKTDPNFFYAEDYAKFTALGITDEDLVILEANRAKARELIRESMILLYEKSNKVIPGWRAKDIIINIVDHFETEAEYLTAAEIQTIAKGNITCLDTTWVLHQTNVDGIDTLVQNTNLGVRGAFDFFDTLPHAEKTDLEKTLYAAHQYVIDDFKKISHLSLDEKFAEINAVFGGAPSQHNCLQAADLPKHIAPKFINIALTERLKKDLLLQMLRPHLDMGLDRLQKIIIAQEPALAKSLIADFEMWMQCKEGHGCPHTLPIPPQNLTAPHAHPLTFSSAVAHGIISSYNGRLGLYQIDEIMKAVANNPRGIEIFNYPQFEAQIQKIADPAEFKALFTADFKAEVAREMAYDIINQQAEEATVEFLQSTLNRPFDIARQLTNELNAAISCYFIIDNAKPVIAEICNSTWKALDSFAVSAIRTVSEQAKIAATAAVHTPITARDEVAENNLPTFQLIALAIGGTLTSSYLLYNLFKKKTATNTPIQASEKKRLLP